MTDEQRIYRVIFLNRTEVWEIYARSVGQGGLFGFVEIEEPLFGEKTERVIDPSEERIKKELEGVQRFHVPMQAVLRIDEVERRGAARITNDGPSDGGRIATFPVPFFPGGGPGRGSKG